MIGNEKIDILVNIIGPWKALNLCMGFLITYFIGIAECVGVLHTNLLSNLPHIFCLTSSKL